MAEKESRHVEEIPQQPVPDPDQELTPNEEQPDSPVEVEAKVEHNKDDPNYRLAKEEGTV